MSPAILARLTDSQPAPLDPPSRVECAWCGTLLKPGVLPISHGICKGCAQQFEREAA